MYLYHFFSGEPTQYTYVYSYNFFSGEPTQYTHIYIISSQESHDNTHIFISFLLRRANTIHIYLYHFFSGEPTQYTYIYIISSLESQHNTCLYNLKQLLVNEVQENKQKIRCLVIDA